MLLTTLAGAFWTAAVAAETGHGEGAHGGGPTSPFAGDLGNIVWTLVIFVLLLLVLGKFAWGPVLNTLQRRESFIRESLEQARRDREAAEQRLREYEQKIRKANEEAGAIVEEARRDAEATRRRAQEQAQAEAAEMIERAKREIGIARDTAIKDLYQAVADMATEIAGKILRRSLNEDEHRRAVEISMEEIREKIGGNGAR